MPDPERDPDSDWLDSVDYSSISDFAWIQSLEQHAFRIGKLLREMHYLNTSVPPKTFNPLLESEDEYWLGRGRNARGLDEQLVLRELARRKQALKAP